MRRILLPFAAVAILLSISGPAYAQTEVTLIAPGGIRAPIEKLLPAFEKKTGYKVNPTFGSGGGTKKQVISGDVFDVPIVQPPLAGSDRVGQRGGKYGNAARFRCSGSGREKGRAEARYFLARSRKEDAAVREINRVPGCGNRSGGRGQHQRHVEEYWALTSRLSRS